MLNLSKHSVADIRVYYSGLTTIGLVDTLINEISKSRLVTQAKIYLTKAKIVEILEAEPRQLEEIHEEFLRALNKNYTVRDYEKYLVAKSKKKLNIEDKKLIRKYDPTIKKLSKIFDYDKYISGKKTKSYLLAKMIGKNTCTYCNRLYTFTIVRRDAKTKRVNDSTRITRPQFDHWFPKKKFPLFALSFYNLIPSCSVCNSSVKGSTLFKLDTHIHPYIIENDQRFKFSYKIRSNGTNEVVMKPYGQKVKKTIEDFKLKEVYDEHSEYELKDLLDLRYKYSDNYLNVLFNDTFDLTEVDKKDAYRFLFGTEIDPAEFHKKPFSKFKYDILRELKVIR